MPRLQQLVIVIIMAVHFNCVTNILIDYLMSLVTPNTPGAVANHAIIINSTEVGTSNNQILSLILC